MATSEPFVEIHCIHCGAYVPTSEEVFDLRLRGILAGYQCYRCLPAEEVKVYVNGQRVHDPLVLRVAFERAGLGRFTI